MNPLIRLARAEDHTWIRDFLLETSSLYPGIEVWWDKRVRPGIEIGERVVLVVCVNDVLEGLFIGRPGKSVKICTLRLRKSIRRQGIGKALLGEGLIRLIDDDTDSVHVTISEAAEEGCIPFFKSAGFNRIYVARNRYCRGVDEFVYSLRC